MPDVPTLFELIDKEKTPERRRLLATVMLDGSGFGPYPIVVAPGVPAERIKILREAFGLTLKTPEFLEEAKKNKWEISLNILGFVMHQQWLLLTTNILLLLMTKTISFIYTTPLSQSFFWILTAFLFSSFFI